MNATDMLKTLRDMAGKATGHERDALIWAIERYEASERAAAYLESAMTSMGRAGKALPEPR